jgi:hypothetical protein
MDLSFLTQFIQNFLPYFNNSILSQHLLYILKQIKLEKNIFSMAIIPCYSILYMHILKTIDKSFTCKDPKLVHTMQFFC